MQSSASIKIASALPFRLGVCISLIFQIGSSSIKLLCLVDFWICLFKNFADDVSIDGYFKWLPILKSSIIQLPLLSLLFMPLFLLKKHPHLLRSLCSAESSSFRKLCLFWSALAAKKFPTFSFFFLGNGLTKGWKFLRSFIPLRLRLSPRSNFRCFSLSHRTNAILPPLS